MVLLSFCNARFRLWSAAVNVVTCWSVFTIAGQRCQAPCSRACCIDSEDHFCAAACKRALNGLPWWRDTLQPGTNACLMPAMFHLRCC